jgi:hypothetical protein
MALHFRDAFKALPIPKEFDNDLDARDKYVQWMEDELIYPAEDAAAAFLNDSRRVTTALKSYTIYGYKTAQTLSGLQPDIYPLARGSHAPPRKEE